jgi:deoxyribonuclease-4
MRLGFHISIAGGFKNVVTRAMQRHCETIQLFSRNPRGWKYRALEPADIELFRKELAEHHIWPLFVHLPYLANLATPHTALFRRSLNMVSVDLKRCAALGAAFLIMHVGSAPDTDGGLRRFIRGINLALQRIQNNVILLLENTAGTGHELGHNFEQLCRIINGVKQSARIGVALDTAHVFAAGYDLRTKRDVDRTLAEFDRTIGLDRLHLVHLNDSQTACGSRKDRHWHIAQGEIGRGIYHILHHPALQRLPFIMETPRTDLKEDLMNMRKAIQLSGRRGIEFRYRRHRRS